MITIAQYLDQYNSNVVKAYFDLIGGKGFTRKADRIEFISKQVLNPDTLRDIWRRLDPVAQRAVSNAYYNDGLFDRQAFIAQYGELPPRANQNAYYSYYYRQPVLFDLFVLGDEIPADLMPLLTDLVLPVDRFHLQGKDTLPAMITRWREDYRIHQAETEIAGRADLLTYLQLVDNGALSWGSTNKELTAGSVRKLYNRLLAGDFHPEPEKVVGRYVIRPFGLDIFARGAGLVTGAGKLSPTGRNYLRSQEPGLFYEAFERWVEQGNFDELGRISQLKGLTARGTRLTPPASRREKIVEALSWCPSHTWISIRDFYRAVKIWQFDFVVELTDWKQLYVGSSRAYGDMTDDDYWFIVNGLYINAVIMEYLATIGAVDIAYVLEDVSMVDHADYYTDSVLSLHDGLLYFRINNWGAFLFGQEDEYTPTLPPRRELFLIDESLQLRVLTDLLPNEKLQLDVLAELVEGRVYRLKADKLLTAVESGQEFDDLADFLTGNHRGVPPPAVVDWLAQLKGNIGVFMAGSTAVMIHLKQPGLLAVIEQDTVLSKFSRPLDKTTVLVSSFNLTRFRKRLKELGYLLGSK